MTNWQGGGAVFSSNPSWIAQQVPGATDLWAPDVSYFGGSYHLYYSASTFGSNHSCIGHATRAALDSGSWTDQGSVVCSNASGSNDNWNAIDPNVVVDDAGTPWLAFGSFWGGLKMVRLDRRGRARGHELHSIAARPSAGGALEAPFIVRALRLLLPVRVVRQLLPRRRQHLQHPRRPVDDGDRPVRRQGGHAAHAGRRHAAGAGRRALERARPQRRVRFRQRRPTTSTTRTTRNNNGASTLRISELAWDADGWPVSAGP